MTSRRKPGHHTTTGFRILLLAGLLLTVPLTSADTWDAYRRLLDSHDLLDPHPTPGNFSICHSNGCEETARVHLNASQWQRIRQLFSNRPMTPQREREVVAQAIALFEQMTGEAADTGDDKGGNLRGFGSRGHQLDCLDESANTTLYLSLLADQLLLRWHEVEARATRGHIIFGWPHNTAVLRDRTDNRLWAVDSWFHDNGHPPEILPLDKWNTGWKPEGFTGF